MYLMLKRKSFSGGFFMKKHEKKSRLWLYILPLVAIHFTSLPSNAANTSYDGQALYTSMQCKFCHDTGLFDAKAIINVADRGDNVTITKNSITTGKSRTGVTTYMDAYSTTYKWTDVQLQAVANYTYPTSTTMAVPTTKVAYSAYSHIETPVVSATGTSAYPIGAGTISSGVLNWQVGLPAFAGSVDIAVAYKLNNGSFNFLGSNNKFTQAASIWKTVSAGTKTNESVIEALGVSKGNLSTSGLPAGTYTLWLFVLPAGNFANGDITKYYAWQTTFTK
jgi:hypothetical protein